MVSRWVCSVLLGVTAGCQVIWDMGEGQGSGSGPGSTTGSTEGTTGTTFPPDGGFCGDATAGEMGGTGPLCVGDTGTGTGTGGTAGAADVTPPAISWAIADNPLVLPEVTGFQLGVNASDDTCIERLDLYVDGEFVASAEPGTFSWELTAPPGGWSIELQAVAVDIAGNEGKSEVLELRGGE